MNHNRLSNFIAAPKGLARLAKKSLNNRVAFLFLFAIMAANLVTASLVSDQDWIRRHGFDRPGWPGAITEIVQVTLALASAAWVLCLLIAQRRLVRANARLNLQERLNHDIQRALDAHSLVSVADADGKIIYANNKFCLVSGYSEAELLGQDHRILNSGYHDQEYIRQMWRTISQGGIWQGDFCNRNRDGGEYWVSSTICPMLDELGKPYQYISVRTEITQLKKLEVEVQEATLRRRMQRLLDASPTVIYAHEDPSSLANCTFIGGNVDKFVGYTAEQILADPSFWQSHLHPDDRQRALATLDRLLVEGELEIDYRMRKANGDYCWIHDVVKVVRNSKGGIDAIIGSWSDITNAKLFEQELLRLRMAAEASVDMIFLTDAEGFIEYANPGACRFSGWRLDEIVGRSARILGSGKMPPVVFQRMWETLLRGEPWSGRLLNRRKVAPSLPLSGQPGQSDYWAEVSITPIRDVQGINLGYVSIQRDITALVAEEERLAMEREDSVVRLKIANILHRQESLETRFSAVLDQLFTLHGLENQQKGGIFLRQEDSENLRVFLLRGGFDEDFTCRERQVPFGSCLCGKSAISGEFLISDDCASDPCYEYRSGFAGHYGHYIVPLSGNGAVLGVMFLYTDPHPTHGQTRIDMLLQIGQMMALSIQQAQAAQTLERARDAAKESSRLKSDFLANMSHEIRTPMNGVLGMLELLELTPMTTEQKEFAETAHHSAEALLSVINDVLDYSKIEAGKLELETVDFDVCQLTEEICTLLARRAHAKGLELNCFVSPEFTGRLCGDPTRLRQVLTNLIGNAIKFTAQGEVSVEVVCLAQDDGQSKLRFTVKDTGIGIDPEVQTRLFQPFIQANGATTRQFGGTGLGLAISKNLIERMGGEVGLYSVVGEGSSFWFTISLAKQPVAEDDGRGNICDLSQRRVLVVDDNATNRKILDHFLSNWGAVPFMAEHAQGALDLLRCADSGPIDLAILDMQMPGMDGLELARTMQYDTALRAVPRILLSSGGLIGEDDWRSVGIAKVLNKPVRQSYLYDAIVATLNEVPVLATVAVPSDDGHIPDYSGRRILLVEDNTTNQKVALRMFARFGLNTELATDGLQALAALERERFDMVFMDCQMPNMDGYEATQRWRQRENELHLPRSPIIALTANAMQSDRDACLAVGMDDHLAKPFDTKKISAMLAQWMGQKSREVIKAPLWSPDKTLKDLDGDRAFLLELMQLLINEEVPQQLDKLRKCMEQQDALALSHAAHSLKGIAGQFCAKSVQELAARVEREARQTDTVPLAMVDELSLAVQDLCTEVVKYAATFNV